MIFISIGPYCITAEILQKHDKRKQSFPFDWIFSSLQMIEHCITDKFTSFLNSTYYESLLTRKATKHLFYQNMLDTDLLLQYLKFTPHDAPVFNHDDMFDNANYEKYQRRAKRLLDLIESEQNICFVYCNFFTVEFTDLVEFSKKFLDRKNIRVIGIFENAHEKTILYQSNNCTIYQNYDRNVIFNEEIEQVELKSI